MNQNLFCKDTSMLIRKWSDSAKDTYTPLIKLSSSREMTKSRIWQCLGVLSCTCCLGLADIRMSANCSLFAFLWRQSQCTLNSPKLNRWPLLVAREWTCSEHFWKDIWTFQVIILSWVQSIDNSYTNTYPYQIPKSVSNFQKTCPYVLR